MNILGKTNVTLAQCITWAKNKRATELFISIVPTLYNTAVREGVNPVLVVVQCAKETGYCRFGGVLNPNFKNTCGLKVSGGGDCKDPNAHQKFASWTDGALAQVQHLALYAGQKGYPVKNPVDPRHFPYLLGRCKTVESLSGNWAKSPYGADLVKMIKEVEATTSPSNNGSEIESLQNENKLLKKENALLKEKLKSINTLSKF